MLTLELKESKQILEIVCLFQYFVQFRNETIIIHFRFSARKVRDSHARMPMQAREAVCFCPRESHSLLSLAQFSLQLTTCDCSDKISSVGQKANSYHYID